LALGKPKGAIYDRVVVQPTADMAKTFKGACAANGLTKDIDKRVFSLAQWKQRASTGVQVLYEEAQTYLPADASVITITADGRLKAMTNYNVPTA